MPAVLFNIFDIHYSNTLSHPYKILIHTNIHTYIHTYINELITSKERRMRWSLSMFKLLLKV